MTGWNEEQTKELLRLYRKGVNRTEIGRRLGKSRNAITGKLIRLKGSGCDSIPITSFKSPFTDEQSLAILDLYENQRQPFHRIARKLLCSSIDVEKHYREIIRELNKSEAA